MVKSSEAKSLSWGCAPCVLQHEDVRLEPLTLMHASGLAQAAADGALWQLHYTSVPAPNEELSYIEKALKQQQDAQRLPFAVIRVSDNTVLGSTGYHDIVAPAQRLEIGYTWYAQSQQRSRLNSICKWLLLEHAFQSLAPVAQVVGWRTDILNTRSQAAIERLGAKLDGVLRGQALRRDGSVRDTVCYSMTRDEWLGGLRQRLWRKLL